MTKLARLISEIRSSLRYGKAEKLQNSGQHQASLSILENFKGSPEYMLKAVLLRAVNYHKMKDFEAAVRHYSEFEAHDGLNHLIDVDREFLCAYAKYYRSAAERHTNSTTTSLIGSISDLRELSECASFTTKREFCV